MLRFISKRLRKGQKASFSSIVSTITVISITFGTMILILSVTILEGFKGTVLKKLFSVEGHLKVSAYDANQYVEQNPILLHSNLYDNVSQLEGIEHIQSFANKSALIKTDDAVEGVVVKGVSSDFYLENFQQNILEGSRFLNFSETKYSNDIMISQRLADKLSLSIGDDIYLFFIQDRPKERKLKVCGIYRTFIEEFDDKVVLCDLALLQKLNKWGDTLVGGYDIFVSDFNQLGQSGELIYDKMDYNLQMDKITNLFPHIFDWLALLNKNVVVFIIIIFVIASFNMLSTMYILMMERANMIGLFQVMGARNILIQRIFWYHGLSLALKGMLLGNIIGLGLCAIQYYTHIIALEPENYYMDFVPIKWDWAIILFINLLVFVLINAIILIPSYLITRMNTIKAIKFN